MCPQTHVAKTLSQARPAPHHGNMRDAGLLKAAAVNVPPETFVERRGAAFRVAEKESVVAGGVGDVLCEEAADACAARRRGDAEALDFEGGGMESAEAACCDGGAGGDEEKVRDVEGGRRVVGVEFYRGCNGEFVNEDKTTKSVARGDFGGGRGAGYGD